MEGNMSGRSGAPAFVSHGLQFMRGMTPCIKKGGTVRSSRRFLTSHRRTPTSLVIETGTAVTTKRKKRKGPAPILHTEGDRLEDTPQMIGIVCATGLVALLEVVYLATQATSPSAVGATVMGIAAGYLFADFGSGIYHWALDNYGDINTPVFGFQIDAFQGHHRSPWTITRRGFFNNVSKPAAVGLPLLTLLLISHLPLAVEGFLLTTLVLSVLAQEFHKWAHSNPPPTIVRALMDAGLLISRKVHGKHHHDPYEGNYCIVSGACNNFLDRVKFFRWLEGFFYKLTGVTPICWTLDPELRREALDL